MAIKVPPSEEGILKTDGFTKRGVYVKFSRVPEETEMMPILPLTNVTQKELPVLTRLMFDAYAKSAYPLPDIRTADERLRSIMLGSQGEYLSSASFASGAFPNLVSACLVTKDSSGVAVISELFTHPLYRARGLATTQIALGMSQLASTGVRSVVAWNREGNEVVSRLLAKMGFRRDPSVVEMAAEC
jgi:RimJ/RimL family protein N-acetyltransferase